MTPHRRFAVPVLIAGVLTLLAPPVQGADDPAEWAPDDTMLYLGIANCDRVGEDVKKTAVWQMFKDPAAGKAVQPYERIFEKLQALAAKKLGLDSPQALEVRPHGALAVWLNARPDGEGDSMPQLVAVADMGADLEKTQHLANVIVQKCTERGGQRETTEAAGSEVVVIRFKKDEAAAEAPTDDSEKDALANEVVEIINAEKLGNEEVVAAVVHNVLDEMEAPEEIAYAFAGSRLVVGSDLPAVRSALMVLREGRDKSLAAGPAVRLLRGKCEGDAPIHLIVNLPEFFKLAAREDEEDFGKFASAANLKAIGPGVLTIAFAPEAAIDGRVRGFLEVRDMDSGIGRMLKMSNTDTKPPATVAANTAMYGMLNIDIAAIVDEVIKITSRMDPAEGEQMRAAMKAPLPDGSTLDIQNDVLAHLTGPLFGRLTMTSPYKPDDLNAIIGVGHNSRQAIDKLMGLLPPGMFTNREMLGAMVYEAQGMIPIMGLQLAVTDRALIPIGTQAAVEAHIRAETSSEGGLAGDARFRELLRHLPDRTCGSIYQDKRRMFDASLAAYKAGPYPDQPQVFGSTLGGILQWQLAKSFFGGELENPEALRKYQTMALATLRTEPDGMRLDVVSMVGKSTD